MTTQELLKKYIAEIIEEMRNASVAQQLLPQTKKQPTAVDDKEKQKDSSNEVEENTVANIVGYTAPLGASSADVGLRPTQPGKKLKKKTKSFIRWK